MLLALATISSITFSQNQSSESAHPRKTRQQVVNDLNDAKAQGQLKFSHADYPNTITPVSALTRAALIAGIQEARKTGALSADFYFNYPFSSDIVAGSGKTREEVKEGITTAMADGKFLTQTY